MEYMFNQEVDRMVEYKALFMDRNEAGFELGYKDMEFRELADGEVRVRIHYSSVNYKDRLAVDPETKVIRSFPMVPGIDFAGVIAESNAEGLEEGDAVVVTGYGFGTDFNGGFREYAEVKRDMLVKLNPGMTLEEAMIYGTAGFTAALSVDAVLAKGIKPEKGRILVTGATGGVGSHAIAILSKLGYNVTAAVRDMESAPWLKKLGASEIIPFSDVMPPKKPLSPIKWAACIDATGGASVASILSEIDNDGIAAISGNASGVKFESTVFPFILRGVVLVGINSVIVSQEKREHIWEKLAGEWKSDVLGLLVRKKVPFGKLKENLTTRQTGSGRDLVVF